MVYTSCGKVDCDVDVDTSSVRGKTAIVTGGANGIGEQYSRKLVEAGAFVIIGDIDEQRGQKLASELKGSSEFVNCDVTQWGDQLAMFKKALSSSPKGRINIVVANAGISGDDATFMTDLSKEDPQEPQLRIFDINGKGVLYTVTLALHYFRRQNLQSRTGSQDCSLVLQASLAGYVDLPGSLQYSFSKFGGRGIMRDLRRTEKEHGIRVNVIAPWFIATAIMNDDFVNLIKSNNIQFATAEDAAGALLRIVTDENIHGRAFAIVPRDWAPRGYYDLNSDDYEKGSLEWQMEQEVSKAVAPIFDQIFAQQREAIVGK